MSHASTIALVEELTLMEDKRGPEYNAKMEEMLKGISELKAEDAVMVTREAIAVRGLPVDTRNSEEWPKFLKRFQGMLIGP